jgi:hypothetical protein
MCAIYYGHENAGVLCEPTHRNLKGVRDLSPKNPTAAAILFNSMVRL